MAGLVLRYRERPEEDRGALPDAPHPRRSTAFLGLLLLAVVPVAAPADEVPTSARAAASYRYPIADPLLATVLGTPPALRAAVPDAIEVERRSLTLFPDREIPRVLWSSKNASAWREG